MQLWKLKKIKINNYYLKNKLIIKIIWKVAKIKIMIISGNSEEVFKRKLHDLSFNLRIVKMKLPIKILQKTIEKMVMKHAQIKVRIKIYSMKISNWKIILILKVLRTLKNKTRFNWIKKIFLLKKDFILKLSRKRA